MALSPQWLDELRTRTSLSGLIQRTLKLQRAGNEWKACCPFHNENTPSFTVNDAKQFYHCFGCGAHGDAISWLTEQRGLAFIDAVKELAAGAGMDMPAPDPAFARREEQRAGLHDVMAAAQEWFVESLARPRGAPARAYLEQRGFAQDIIERFGFGWAPNERAGLRQSLARFGDDMLVEAGLLIALDGDAHTDTASQPYDRFRGRIMLPIHDLRGRIIAFGGRILEAQSKAPKYLNSPDTPLFDKGRTLYNLHRAGPAARKAGQLVVVEGYMDVVALAAAGIEEAVAPMGTALTPEQLALAWRIADKPVLCFDGDTAGARAAMRAVQRALPLLVPGRSLDFALLPGGLDPDDLIRRDGKEALERVLGQPHSLLDMIWRHEHSAHPLTTPEDKAGLKARLLAHVDMIAERDIRSLYRRELLDRFSAFAFPPRTRTAQSRSFTRPTPLARLPVARASELRRAVEGGARDRFAHAVLSGLARHPSEITRHAEALVELAAMQPHIAARIDALLAPGLAPGEELEARDRSPICEPEASIGDFGRLRYSFLEDGHDAQARTDLSEAVALLVEKPALELAIASVTARFEDDPEAAFSEQQRLRTRKLEIDARIGQLARKRVAVADAGYDKGDQA